MRLAFRAGAGMAGVSSRIIDDVELYRFEAGFELGADPICNTHGAHVSRAVGGSVKSVLPSPQKSRIGKCRGAEQFETKKQTPDRWNRQRGPCLSAVGSRDPALGC